MQTNNVAGACTDLIRSKLSKVTMEQSGCTIHRVHSHLRNVNDKAYEPEVIAIGPYHRDKDNLEMMEDHKLRYLYLLLQRGNQDIKTFVSAIAPLESEARKCYAAPINLNPTKFIEMLVLDGCFIIDLVRKCNMKDLRERKDPIFNMDWIMNSLQRDLMLFENQIPFRVICKLFDLIEVPNQHCRLIYLLLSFFSSLYPVPGKVYRNRNGCSDEVKHLLDLLHKNWLPSCDKFDLGGYTEEERKRWRFINSASRLRETNVKFERKEGVPLSDVQFKNGTIFLASFTVEDRTESFFRNLIAYEQYFLDTDSSCVTGFVKLLDCLIDSSRDVAILSRSGIIDNWLGDDEVVANMFNKLTDSVSGPGHHFVYSEIFDAVNEYCSKRRNRWMAKLRRNYLNSPWAVISILAAVAVLLLSATQTVFSIHSQKPCEG